MFISAGMKLKNKNKFRYYIPKNNDPIRALFLVL
jgi:hypothetical protein